MSGWWTHKLAAAGSLILALSTPAAADFCDRFADHRDGFLLSAQAGLEEALDTMASDRGVTRRIALVYWGGSLLQETDPASLRSLAQLTLVTYHWSGYRERAEASMTRLFDERGSVFAGLLAGLMLSDELGPRDPYRARLYLAAAARAGSPEAPAFLGLYDLCHNRAMALN